MSESSLGENDDSENDDCDEFDELPKRPFQQYYTMHDSLRAVAELMSQQMLPCFTPEDDQYNCFSSCIKEENKIG